MHEWVSTYLIIGAVVAFFTADIVMVVGWFPILLTATWCRMRDGVRTPPGGRKD